MKIFNQYSIGIAFYNDDEIITLDEDAGKIPEIRGCRLEITNLDNKQNKYLKIKAHDGFKDTPAEREALRNVAIEKARQAVNTYERNLHTLRTSKS